jgi:hypothetical protein
VTTTPSTLPYRFDTSSVWHTIIKGAAGLNALLIVSFIFAIFNRSWPAAVGLAVSEFIVFHITRLVWRLQEGSVGTLWNDRVEIEPNVLLGLPLPGPRGSYSLDRFSGIRVEFRSGPTTPGVQGGPNEVVWLMGKADTPQIALARTDNGAGRAVGRQFAALLKLPVEEVGAPVEIRL